MNLAQIGENQACVMSTWFVAYLTRPGCPFFPELTISAEECYTNRTYWPKLELRETDTIHTLYIPIACFLCRGQRSSYLSITRNHGSSDGFSERRASQLMIDAWRVRLTKGTKRRYQAFSWTIPDSWLVQILFWKFSWYGASVRQYYKLLNYSTLSSIYQSYDPSLIWWWVIFVIHNFQCDLQFTLDWLSIKTGSDSATPANQVEVRR